MAPVWRPHEFVQQPGARLPLEVRLRDESGRRVRLGDYFGDRPVVLVFGYFRCRNVCTTVMDGVLESLARAGADGEGAALLAVSIAPDETPEMARTRMAAFHGLLERSGATHFLTGDGAAVALLAGEAGFSYGLAGDGEGFEHPAGFLVATPDGRVSRYFLGVRFTSRDLRLALVEASGGRVGSVADRLVLLCSHFEPLTGRYSLAVMAVVRGLCLVLALSLAGWVAYRRRGR